MILQYRRCSDSIYSGNTRNVAKFRTVLEYDCVFRVGYLNWTQRIYLTYYHSVQLILSFVEQMADMEPQRNRILYFDSQDIALSLRFFGNYIVTRFYDEIIVSNLRTGKFLQFFIPNCLAWSITDDHVSTHRSFKTMIQH